MKALRLSCLCLSVLCLLGSVAFTSIYLAKALVVLGFLLFTAGLWLSLLHDTMPVDDDYDEYTAHGADGADGGLYIRYNPDPKATPTEGGCTCLPSSSLRSSECLQGTPSYQPNSITYIPSPHTFGLAHTSLHDTHPMVEVDSGDGLNVSELEVLQDHHQTILAYTRKPWMAYD